jgi:hypothetical protein
MPTFHCYHDVCYVWVVGRMQLEPGFLKNLIFFLRKRVKLLNFINLITKVIKSFTLKHKNPER